MFWKILLGNSTFLNVNPSYFTHGHRHPTYQTYTRSNLLPRHDSDQIMNHELACPNMALTQFTRFKKEGYHLKEYMFSHYLVGVSKNGRDNKK